MSVLTNHFYHKTITLYTGVFGSIFNEIKIKREEGKIILVPIAYSAKQKYDVRNEQNPDPNKVRYKMQLPRMGFRLIGLRKDNERITNKMHRIRANYDLSQDGVEAQYNRVPFTFQYELNLKTKTLDDMFQLIEQILVYFNPALRVNVLDNPDLGADSAIHVKLIDSGLDSMFEGSFEMEQVIETTMQFELEGWLYMPTNNVKVIKQINLNYYDMNKPDVLLDSQVITE
jgi:hypothetical protein